MTKKDNGSDIEKGKGISGRISMGEGGQSGGLATISETPTLRPASIFSECKEEISTPSPLALSGNMERSGVDECIIRKK